MVRAQYRIHYFSDYDDHLFFHAKTFSKFRNYRRNSFMDRMRRSPNSTFYRIVTRNHSWNRKFLFCIHCWKYHRNTPHPPWQKSETRDSIWTIFGNGMDFCNCIPSWNFRIYFYYFKYIVNLFLERVPLSSRQSHEELYTMKHYFHINTFYGRAKNKSPSWSYSFGAEFH